MRRLRVALLVALVPVGTFASCTSDDEPAPASSVDASVTIDASLDQGARPDTTTTTPDTSTNDVATEAAPIDAGPDAAEVDAEEDAPVDAGPDVFDAGPQFDDAGCPIPTGVTADMTDAGFPGSGVVLWLRADLGVATVNAETDGGTVCRWDDLSGHGNAFAPSGVAPPITEPTGLKGKPTVYFNGQGRTMARGDVLGIPATAGRTVAVMASNADLTRRYQHFYQGQLGTPGTYFGIDTNTFSTSGSKEGVYLTNNAYDSNLATSTNPRMHVLSVSSFVVNTALPGAITYAVDGTTLTLTRTAGGLGSNKVENFANANFTIIGASAAAGGHLGARISEMLVWDRELTTPERQAVEAYFSARYP